jgi:hypothetical protein
MVSGSAVHSDSVPLLRPGGDDSGERPEVMFRCEEGRLGAYLVTAPAGDDGVFGEQMVPISLDSAPSCTP